MAIADGGVARRWPWVESGQPIAVSDLGMQIFRAAGDDAKQPVVLADADGAIVYANQAFHEMGGHDSHQITPGGMADLSGMSLEAVEHLWQELRRGVAWRREHHALGASAKNERCWSSISPLQDGLGRVTHILWCQAGLREHDAAENALRGGQNGAAVDRTGDDCFVAVIDRDERIVYNKCTQPGFSNADVIGTVWRQYYPPEQHEVVAPRVATAFRTGADDSFEILAAGAYGRVVHYASWVGPIIVGGQVIAVVVKSREVLSRDVNGGAGASSNEETVRRKAQEMDAPLLSQRELEVMRLIADGLMNHEIADSLGIAMRTVDHHVAHILTKLGAANRTSAVYLAMRAELIDLP